MKAVRTILSIVGALIAVGATCALADGITDPYLQPLDMKRDLTYKADNGYVDVFKDNKTVARYIYKDTSKPYLYPINAPCGETLTSNEPVSLSAGGPVTGKSMWIGLGDVNGIDFWNEGAKAGKIVQQKIDFKSFNSGYWNIHAVNDWIGPDGKKIVEEDRRYSFLSCQYGTVVSNLITLTAVDAAVKLGDTVQGFLAYNVAPGLRFKNGKGQVINSEGNKNEDCSSRRARWCDVTGEVNGKTCGITIFEAPSNYGAPTYWRVTDNGTVAANPFSGKSFTNNPTNDSSFTLEPRMPLSFIYVTLLHDGKFDAKLLDAIAGQLVGKPLPKPSSDSDQDIKRNGPSSTDTQVKVNSPKPDSDNKAKTTPEAKPAK